MPAEVLEEEEIINEDGTVSAPSEPQGTSGPIKNRADAFRRLNEVSEYFRKTEPHSPISYSIEKTIKWGDMSLSELMRELVPEDALRSYGSLTGIKTDDE